MNQSVKPQLHQSMIDMMCKCGIQFQRRYGYRFGCWHQEEIIPPGTALATGSSVHKSVEVNLRNKMSTGALLPVEEVETAARDHFLGMASGNFLFTDEEALDVKATLGQGVDTTIALARLHYTELAPKIEPVAVEEPFVLELVGRPFDLSGQIDIRLDGAIRDTKTAKVSPTEDAARSMQMGMYSLAYRAKNDVLPEKVYLDYLVKTKEPKLVTREAVPDDGMVKTVLNRVQQATKIIQSVAEGKGEFTPADPTNWVCTEKFCGYARTCPYWSGR